MLPEKLVVAHLLTKLSALFGSRDCNVTLKLLPTLPTMTHTNQFHTLQGYISKILVSYPRQVRVGFVVDKVALKTDFSNSTSVTVVSTVSPMLHTHVSFIY